MAASFISLVLEFAPLYDRFWEIRDGEVSDALASGYCDNHRQVMDTVLYPEPRGENHNIIPISRIDHHTPKHHCLILHHIPNHQGQRKPMILFLLTSI